MSSAKCIPIQCYSMAIQCSIVARMSTATKQLDRVHSVSYSTAMHHTVHNCRRAVQIQYNATLQVNKRNRLESLIRLLARSEALGHPLTVDEMVRFRVWAVRYEAAFCQKAIVKAAIGQMWLAEVNSHMLCMSRDSSSFRVWLAREMGKLPADLLVM